MSENKEKIIEMIEKMTVLELSELVEALKEKFNVTAAAPVAAVAMPAGAQGEGEASEKTTVTLVLESAGDKKLQVIKTVKKILDVSLKDAKAFVDGAPKELKKDIPNEEAEKIKEELESAGAVVTLK